MCAGSQVRLQRRSAERTSSVGVTCQYRSGRAVQCWSQQLRSGSGRIASGKVSVGTCHRRRLAWLPTRPVVAGAAIVVLREIVRRKPNLIESAGGPSDAIVNLIAVVPQGISSNGISLGTGCAADEVFTDCGSVIPTAAATHVSVATVTSTTSRHAGDCQMADAAAIR